MVLKLSKKHLKANHNDVCGKLHDYELGFKIVKETFESKSQLIIFCEETWQLGFKIVKETFESKSQLQTVQSESFISWF